MRKAEHEALQKFFNRITELEDKREKAFDRLRDANKEITGTAWCSAKANYEDLRKAGVKTDYTYQQYIEYGAQIDILRELGRTLAEIDFWK